MYDNEGIRQRRSVAAAPPPQASLGEVVLDKIETVVHKGMSVCHFLAGMTLVACAIGAGCEGLYLLVSHPDILDYTPSYGSISFFDHPFDDGDKSVALVMANMSLPHHAAFIKDARAANSKHEVNLVMIDCGTHADACKNKEMWEAHESIPETLDFDGEEPEMLFVRQRAVTDSYHVGLKDASMHKGSRVKTMLAWLDMANSRAASRKDAVSALQKDKYKMPHHGAMGGGMPDMGMGDMDGMGMYGGHPGSMDFD